MLNPMTPLIELFRSAYLGSPCYYMNYYWLSIAITLVVFGAGRGALFPRGKDIHGHRLNGEEGYNG